MEEIKERIWVHEMLELINKKDYRSAIKWCTRHGIKLVKDGVNRYALRKDFINAYNAMSESSILAPTIDIPIKRYQPKGKLACETKIKNNE